MSSGRFRSSTLPRCGIPLKCGYCRYQGPKNYTRICGEALSAVFTAAIKAIEA